MRSNEKDPQYIELEKEANAFASELLAPNEAINSIPNIDNFKSIAKKFDISYEFAKIKFSNYKRIGKKEKSNIKYYTFKESLGITDNYNIGAEYYLICKHCGNKIINQRFSLWINGEIENINENICSICGNIDFEIINEKNYFEFREQLISGDVHVMNYNGIKVENGIAIICPKCSCTNDNINPFCEICGTYLVNRCLGVGHSDFNDFINDPFILNKQTDELGNDISEYVSCNNGQILSGKSRYCPFCGSVTSFYIQQLLDDYKIELKNNKIDNKNTLPF